MIDFITYYINNYPLSFALLSFLLGVLTDLVWVMWTKNANDLKPLAAANWSALIYLFGVIYTLVIIEKNVWQIGAYCLGAWVGTFWTVHRIKKRNKQNGAT